jgi:hypothetical protein
VCVYATNIVECSTEHLVKIRFIMTIPGIDVRLALLQILCVGVDTQGIIHSKSWNRRMVTLDTSKVKVPLTDPKALRGVEV